MLPHGRPSVQLAEDRGLEADTRSRRARAFRALVTFSGPAGATALYAGADARAIDSLLVAYGQHRYDTLEAGPQPYKDAIQGTTDQHRHLRGCLPRAWDAVQAWETLEPGTCRVPLPHLAFRAMVALALAWRWPLFAVLLTLGYHAALRPGELLKLEVADVLLPEDLLHGLAHGFVLLRSPKTRKTFAANQHVRLDDPFIIRLLRAARAGRPRQASLWPWAGAPATRARAFRAQWDALTAAIGIPSVLPSGIRAGAVTWYYDCGMGLDDLQWLGRWAVQATLKRYIQEIASVRVLAELSPPARAHLLEASELVLPLAQDWLRAQEGPPHA